MSVINLAMGIFKLWRFMDARQEKLQRRKKEEGVSPEESKALEVVLETGSSYQVENSPHQEKFLPDTLHLISCVAAIYYPDEKEPLQKARVGNVLTAFQEMNRQVLEMIELPGLEELTQFRLREVVPGFSANENNAEWIRAFFPRWLRLRVMRALWAQWFLSVGEAAIKVYGEHRADEIPDPETLLNEMDQLQGETDLSLPDEVRDIVEASRKNILFSIKPLSWAEVKSTYISLAKNIARVWHPQSPEPLYEVRVYDLLESMADYLEWFGNLSQKPVLNKMLGLRISHITGVKEVVLPFTDNQFFDWARKYQVERAAKWSRTIFKTLRKKQPAILFRDVAIGVVKEGAKRWLILYLHDKISEETNNLYKPEMNRDGQRY